MNIMNMEYLKALFKQCNNNNLLFEGLKKNQMMWKCYFYAKCPLYYIIMQHLLGSLKIK